MAHFCRWLPVLPTTNCDRHLPEDRTSTWFRHCELLWLDVPHRLRLFAARLPHRTNSGYRSFRE